VAASTSAANLTYLAAASASQVESERKDERTWYKHELYDTEEGNI